MLQGVLEKHHGDLCRLAEELKSAFSKDMPEPVIFGFKDNPLLAALREHMPRVSLWKRINRWEKLALKFQISLEALEDRIRNEATAATTQTFVSRADEPGLSEGLVQALAFHIRSRAGGGEGLSEIEVQTVPDVAGVVIQHGAYRIALVARDRGKEILETYQRLTRDSLNWVEVETLSKLVAELMNIRRDICTQLTTVILRRMVPGKCNYCPF